MKAVTRHSLELCLSAEELLELCSAEDLRDIPKGLTPTVRAVRYDEGSPMVTVTLAFVLRVLHAPLEDITREDVEAAVDAQMAQLGAEVKAAAAPLVDEPRPRRKRS